MKKVLLLGVSLILGLCLVSQAQFRGYTSYHKASHKRTRSTEPGTAKRASSVISPLTNRVKSANIVNVITLGTSSNGYDWDYDGGQRDHLWADNDLKAIVQIHNMGPGSTPPRLSGYLAMDHALNYGANLSDWSIGYQVYASTLNSGQGWYYDEGHLAQGGIYNPPGNTSASNSYLCFFAECYSSITTDWGGYCYGRVKWGSQSDSTHHINWFSPPPNRFIPDGFTITSQGKAFAIDVEVDQSNNEFDNGLYLSTGTWNNTTHEFDYTFSTIPMDSPFGEWPCIERIAADPTGKHVWIGTIANNGGATPVFDSTYYPVFFHSSDGGTSWGSPIAVQLDGPNGIPAVLNYISDARLATVYAGSTVPSRDEIAYTCAFDGKITVDKWGNPHMAVAIGLPGGGFSILSPDGTSSPRLDSTMAVFDIYSTDLGATWCGRMMGITKRFRTTFDDGGYNDPLDLRPGISRNATGDKIFVTWNDTWLTNITDNSAPDIIARGWDLVTDKLTNSSGQDAGTNVTSMSDVSNSAFCGDQAQIAFTKSDGSHLIPMVCELVTSLDLDNPITFKYISDFSYAQSSFTINAAGPVWGSACNFPVGIRETASASLTASVYPNPVRGIASVKVTVPQKGLVTVQLTNLVGQTVMNLSGNVENTETFSLDASRLPSGVYFYTVKQGDRKITGKIIVE